MNKILTILFLTLSLGLLAQEPIFELDFRNGSFIEKVTGEQMTLTVRPPFTVGAKGVAASFVDSDYLIQATSAMVSNVNTITTEGTIVLWVKFNYPEQSFHGIINTGATADKKFDIWRQSEKMYFAVDFGGTGTQLATSSGIPLGSAYGRNYIHVIGTFGAGIGMKIYINGEQRATTTVTPTKPTIPYLRMSDWANKTVFGDLARVQIFNTGFSVQDVQNSYAEFQASRPTLPRKRNFTYPKPTDLSHLVNGKVVNQIFHNFDTDQTAPYLGTRLDISYNNTDKHMVVTCD